MIIFMFNNLYYYFLLVQCEIGVDIIIDENYLYVGVEGYLVVFQSVGIFIVFFIVVILVVIEVGVCWDVIGNLWV